MTLPSATGNCMMRHSPLYRPYHHAVLQVAGRAKRPAGTLRDARVIGRGMLFDAIRSAPEVVEKMNGAKIPESIAARGKKIDPREDHGAFLVLAKVMEDLGYSRYSDHAWSRHPCGVV